MFVSDIDRIEAKSIMGNGAKNVRKQVLVGPEQGWQDYVLRRFTLGKDGCSALHSHPWQHIVYILEGKGTLFTDGTEYPLRAGSTAYIPPDAMHRLSNAGDEPFVFLCIVPACGDR